METEALIIKEKKILELFKQGKKLTVNQVTADIGYTELRSYVCRLIKAGYKIVRKYAEGGNYKEYWLAND
jgi:hypothetical protein